METPLAISWLYLLVYMRSKWEVLIVSGLPGRAREHLRPKTAEWRSP